VKRNDEIWKTEGRAKRFLEGIRPAMPWVSEQLEAMFRVIEARGEDVNSFVDLGCGGGMLTEAILDRYPQSSGALVDFSKTMLKEAERNMAGRSDNLRFIEADLGVETWVSTLKDCSPFDLIASGFCIHHQADERKRQLYGEIYDLLKPGGLFINIERVASSTKWLEMIFYDALSDSMYKFHSDNGSTKTKEQIFDEIVNGTDRTADRLASVEAQCGWLRDLGFQDVDCFFKMFDVAVFGGRRPQVRL